MSDDSGDKTEPASEKRRQEFREKGDVARSRDIISVLVLFSAFAYFMVFGRHIYHGLGNFLTRYFTFRPELGITPGEVMNLGKEAAFEMAYIMAPLVGMVVLVSILGNVAQVGVLITTKPLEPDFSRLNFFARFLTTFFNKQAFGNLITSLAKIVIVVIVIYMTLSDDGQFIKAISTLGLQAGISYLLDRCMDLLLNVSLVLIFIAIADFMWNKYVMEEKMKMTRQEVKDEHKEYEGNPHLKGQMRKRAMEMSNQRMMQDVPQADVVVNNPTHISVALRYRQGEDAAPIVLAKGADFMAMRIRRAARKHGVPMVENKPLARSLYRTVKVGKPVPSRFYRAVAEVLAYVYRLKKTGQARSTGSTGSNARGARSDSP
ncbi:MAG: flagellar biosynthesis protein FlhB [Myxococcota bacterium]|nr:flagellar biosynthesis protein FlhB [Myxococcota bacterium]